MVGIIPWHRQRVLLMPAGSLESRAGSRRLTVSIVDPALTDPDSRDLVRTWVAPVENRRMTAVPASFIPSDRWAYRNAARIAKIIVAIIVGKTELFRIPASRKIFVTCCSLVSNVCRGFSHSPLFHIRLRCSEPRCRPQVYRNNHGTPQQPSIPQGPTQHGLIKSAQWLAHREVNARNTRRR